MAKKTKSELEDELIDEQIKFRDVTVKMANEVDLPKIIEERKHEIIEEVSNYMEVNGIDKITHARLYEIMSLGTGFRRTQFSAEELFIAFEVFKSITSDLTLKNPRHFPSKQSFCSFIGVTTRRFGMWKEDDDIELVRVVDYIEDYISDVQITMAQMGIINPQMTMFRMKTEHGYVQPTEVIAITNEINTDTQDIRQRVAAAKGVRFEEVEVREK